MKKAGLEETLQVAAAGRPDERIVRIFFLLLWGLTFATLWIFLRLFPVEKKTPEKRHHFAEQRERERKKKKTSRTKGKMRKTCKKVLLPENCNSGIFEAGKRLFFFFLKK